LNEIWTVIVHLYGYLAVLPIVPFVAIWLGYGTYINDRKKAMRIAMDVTTVFLIGVVAVLFNEVFASQFGLYGILLFMLIGAGLLGNAQFRKRSTVDAKKIFRTIWRLTFFATSLFYVLFMFIYVTQKLFAGAA
jgi:energy-converting hydrogenase Eha subunit A